MNYLTGNTRHRIVGRFRRRLVLQVEEGSFDMKRPTWRDARPDDFVDRRIGEPGVLVEGGVWRRSTDISTSASVTENVVDASASAEGVAKFTQSCWCCNYYDDVRFLICKRCGAAQ